MNPLPRLLWTWMLLLLLACHARAQAQFKPVPPLRTRVTDEVGMLTPGQRQQLESALASYETNEAGRGVQGVLTDAQSKRILQDTIAPHFHRHDWYGGLHAGVGAIEVLLDQESYMAPRRYTRSQAAGYAVLAVFAFVGLGFIVGGFIVIRAGRRSGRNARRRRRVRHDTASIDSTPAFAFDSNDSGSAGSSDADGGGASGDWDD